MTLILKRTELAPTPYFDPIESASVDELRALQLTRLRHSIEWAYNRVPHYRKKYDDAGVHPCDLKTLADLEKFPFTTKADLRENYPYGMFAVPTSELVRLHASSGSTGKATIVGYTKGDLDNWSHVMARSIYAAGGRPGDLVHNAKPYGLFTGGLGAHYGAEYLGAAVIPASGGSTERQVQLICDLRPDIIMATPSYMLVIVDEFERQKISPRECSLRIGMFGGEPWTESMRVEIETRMGIDVHDLYGLSEVVGPGVCAECAESKGMLTIWEDHFYPEMIDPATGELVGDGEAGGLVLTTLTKEGMPVIRYRTRDLTRLAPGIGRPMRRMERVKGRSDDMFIVRGVNVFPSQIETVLAQVKPLAPYYVIDLHREGRLDDIDVTVELRQHLAGMLDPERRVALEREASHQIKALIGITARVHVAEPGTLERSQGKAKRVRDRRVM